MNRLTTEDVYRIELKGKTLRREKVNNLTFTEPHRNHLRYRHRRYITICHKRYIHPAIGNDVEHLLSIGETLDEIVVTCRKERPSLHDTYEKGKHLIEDIAVLFPL